MEKEAKEAERKRLLLQSALLHLYPLSEKVEGASVRRARGFLFCRFKYVSIYLSVRESYTFLLFASSLSKSITYLATQC